MLSILKSGGLKTGGVNFDAKVRRESFEAIDLFYAHIGGMDAFAAGTENRLRHPAGRTPGGVLSNNVNSSWDGSIGREIELGKSSFAALEKYTVEKKANRRPTPADARSFWKT